MATVADRGGAPVKLCTFDESRLGLTTDDGLILDVTDALDRLPAAEYPAPWGDPLITHLDAVTAEINHLAKSAVAVQAASVALGSPVLRPSKIIAAPGNYWLHLEIDNKDPGVHHNVHVEEMAGLDRPVVNLGLFLKANTSLGGPSDGIRINWPDRRNDFECEIAIIIGDTCKDVPVAEAHRHIAGYTIGLDITVRGREDRSFRKSADGYSVLGPHLVTKDEMPALDDIEFWLRLNGEERQRSSTKSLLVPIDELVSMASHAYTLYPGDVIFTGTAEGVGEIRPGDHIEAGADGVGTMSVHVHERQRPPAGFQTVGTALPA